MKVLVTGATGFLGSWVARALAASGHAVRALARRPERLRALGLSVEAVQGDVLSPESLRSALRGIDAVAHCAGMVSWRPRDAKALRRTNVAGTRNLLDAAAGLRVLHTSSIVSVGPTRVPRELTEDSPAAKLDFDCAYTISKRKSEGLALDRARAGTDVVVLNPGIVLGPGDVSYASTQVVLRYLRGELHHHLGGGSSFCDVRDVADAYVAALERGRSGERYLLAGINRSHAEVREDLRRLTGLQRSFPVAPAVAEWAALWSEASARFVAHPFEDVSVAIVRWASLFHYCSAAKAERELGYRRRPFAETLADTIGDHLRRGGATATTPQLRALLARAKHA